MASLLQVFLVGVNEWMSHWDIPSSGLNLGAMSVIWVSASWVHICGFLQLISLSLVHLMQVHVRHGMCGPM
jgi:hypothetical protein